MKVFIPIILFYGNKKCLYGVCVIGFMGTVTFKNYCLYEKVLCVCLGDGVKCVGFVSALFLKLLKCEKYMREKMSWFCLIHTTLTVF